MPFGLLPKILLQKRLILLRVKCCLICETGFDAHERLKDRLFLDVVQVKMKNHTHSLMVFFAMPSHY